MLLLLNFLISVVFAQDLSPLHKALSEVDSNKYCQIKMEQSFFSSLMETTRISQSQFYSYQKLFRFDTFQTNKSTLLFDGKVFWILEYDKINDKDPSQITKTDKPKNQNLFFKDLFDKKKFEKSFSVKEVSNNPKKLIYEIKPLSENFLPLKNIKLTIINNSLFSLEYQDDIENQTSLKFISIKCEKSVDKNKFIFKPNSNNNVITL